VTLQLAEFDTTAAADDDNNDVLPLTTDCEQTAV